MNIYTHIGRSIRRRRRIMSMTQLTLAHVCGVTFQQIQKYECAHNRTPVDKLWLIAGALQVPIGYFFEGFVPDRDPPRDFIRVEAFQ